MLRKFGYFFQNSKFSVFRNQNLDLPNSRAQHQIYLKYDSIGGFTFSVRLFKWKAQQKLCFTYCDLDRIDSFGLNMKRRQYVSIYIRSISLVFIGLIRYKKHTARQIIITNQWNSRDKLVSVSRNFVRHRTRT